MDSNYVSFYAMLCYASYVVDTVGVHVSHYVTYVMSCFVMLVVM